MSQPAILLISYHFYPSIEIGARRVTALARYLAERGIKVIVVSEFGGRDFAAGTQIWPGVIAIPVKRPRRLVLDTLLDFKRLLKGSAEPAGTPTKPAPAPVAAPSGNNPSWLHRAFFQLAYFVDAYKRWALHASRAAIQAGREHGARLVLSSGPPHTMLLAGMRAAERLRIPHIADLRDPWTDHVPPTPASPRGVELRALRALERRVMNSAAAITSTGENVANILAGRYASVGSKVHVIRNGFDGEKAQVPVETGGRLSILFAGELYAKRNPFPLFTALENMLARADVDAACINVTFMGRCAAYNGESLDAWLRGKKAAAVVKILPQMPPEAVAEAVSQSTVLLNLAQQQPLSVPAKTFEHLASGREILLICEDDSETARVVAGIPGVLQVDQAHPEALEAMLLDLYRRHVVAGKLTAPGEEYIRPFSRTAMNDKFLAVMRSAAKMD